MKRKVIRREIVALQVLLMMGGLSETVIESPFAGACHVRPCPFEHQAILLIDMESLIDHVCGKSSRLRNTEDVRKLGIGVTVDRQR